MCVTYSLHPHGRDRKGCVLGKIGANLEFSEPSLGGLEPSESLRFPFCLYMCVCFVMFYGS